MADTLPPSLLAPPAEAPTELTFRLATIADLAPLHAACYPERPWPPFRAHGERLLAHQEKGWRYWLLAEEKGIVGSGQLLRYPFGDEIANLAVTPAWRGRGVGTALLRLFFRLGRHLGITELEIGVDVGNSRALSLYHREGFTVRRKVNLPTGETAVFLTKSLIP